MSSDLTKWRIFCLTENIWSEGWLDSSEGLPVRCFNDGGHSVNPNSCQEIDSTSVLTVKIKQESIQTGGNFKSKGYSFECGANNTSTYNVSWPYPITAMVVHLQTDSSQKGDLLSAVVGSQTTVGVILSQCSEGDTTVSVNSTVIAHSYVGYECFIGTESLGRILEIDAQNLTVRFETPATQNHPANSYFKIQMRIIESHNMGFDFGNDIGVSNIGGKYLPANVPTRVEYINNNSENTVCRFTIEYLY